MWAGYNFAGCWSDSGGIRMSSKKPIVTVKEIDILYSLVCTSAFKNHQTPVSRRKQALDKCGLDEWRPTWIFNISRQKLHCQDITMNSLLAAVLDLAGQDLLKKRVKNNIPEMHWKERAEEISGSLNNYNQSLKYYPNNKLPPYCISAVQSKNNYFLGKQNCLQNVQM